MLYYVYDCCYRSVLRMLWSLSLLWCFPACTHFFFPTCTLFSESSVWLRQVQQWTAGIGWGKKQCPVSWSYPPLCRAWRPLRPCCRSCTGSAACCAAPECEKAMQVFIYKNKKWTNANEYTWMKKFVDENEWTHCCRPHHRSNLLSIIMLSFMLFVPSLVWFVYRNSITNYYPPWSGLYLEMATQTVIITLSNYTLLSPPCYLKSTSHR